MSDSHPHANDQPTLPPSQPPADSSLAETLPPSGPTEIPGEQENVQVPGYEILGELGRGGMGVVYKARQKSLGRLVALKVILAGSHASEQDLARFRTEAEVIARLQHPNIVQIHEVGKHEGRPFFSLEFCSSGSLERKLAEGQMPLSEVAIIMETLARAMHAVHIKEIVHRDLKPANVLLTEEGTLKITDFGLAKKLGEARQTATGAVLGTPSYMAPEQANGKKVEVGPAADVFALGAIMYECLTGRPPFKAETMLETLQQVVADDPVPPSHLQSRVPQDLEAICLKCLRPVLAGLVAVTVATAASAAQVLLVAGIAGPVLLAPPLSWLQSDVDASRVMKSVSRQTSKMLWTRRK